MLEHGAVKPEKAPTFMGRGIWDTNRLAACSSVNGPTLTIFGGSNMWPSAPMSREAHNTLLGRG